MPLVSVLMKSYNHEHFLSDSIESVLEQDFDDFELIIVDDASTDSSRHVIQSYQEKDPRIRVIFHERNMGISKTVNDGIEAAKGKFVAQIDSDDSWAKDKLKKQLAVLKRHEDLIVWSEGELIDQSGRSLGKSFSDWLRRNPKKEKGRHIWQELLKGNYIFGSSVVYKKQNIANIRYDERLPYLNDYKFYLELARKYQFYYMPESLAKYRIHEHNAISGLSAESMNRLRQAGIERVSIWEEILEQYDHEIARKTKAIMFSKMGVVCFDFGQKKKGLNFFLRAVRYNPFERELLRISRFALKRSFNNLLSPRHKKTK